MKLKLQMGITAALLIGAATVASAQTRADAFADQLRTMESLQSVGTYTFKPAPSVSSKPTDPIVRETFVDRFAAMQAESSNSGQWKGPEQAAPAFARAPADPARGASFGDSFALMQAASSNSDAWKLQANEGAPAYATASATTFVGEPTAPAFAQRIARALNLRGGPASN